MKLKINYRAFNSGGPGGQHSNRSENAIEASVEVPGIGTVKATSSMKSQHRSKQMAKAILLSRVKEALRPREERRQTAGFGPGGRVRTYAMHRSMVIDDSGFKVPWSGRELGDIVERRARRMRLAEEGGTNE